MVADTRADPHLTGHRDVTERGIGSYVSAPIVDGEGKVYGILCGTVPTGHGDCGSP
ncbi:GAF domain-containing protein [Frankia tisae]|uniref:GAF domain-containing protein n=1 Tax=Frankia tisae TaxID=2950104 RepID=UPI003555E245